MVKKNSYTIILTTLISLILMNGCKQEAAEDVISEPVVKLVENFDSTEKKSIPEVKNIEFFNDDEPAAEKVETKKKKQPTREKLENKTKQAKPVKVQEKAKVIKKKDFPKPIKKGKLSFSQEEYDFGFIEVGEIVDYTFNFKNTGNADVNISNAVASCGCTTPVFPFLPIEPGKTGAISVRFNSKDRLGGQLATVTVYSDAENKEQELKLKGVIRSEIVSPAEFVDTTKN